MVAGKICVPTVDGRGKKGCGGGVVVQMEDIVQFFLGTKKFLLKIETCDLRVFKREALSKRNRRFSHLFTLSCGVPTWTSGGGRGGPREEL